MWDPTFSVYKGRCLSKQAEEYLAFSGLKNAAYSICSTDLKEDVFGTLVPCSHQVVLEETYRMLLCAFGDYSALRST